MASTQLFFDFYDLETIPVKTNTVKVIPFPTQLAVQIKQEKQTGQAVFARSFTSFEPYGSWVNYNKRLTSSERLRINKEAVALLAKPMEQLSPAELNTLRSYSGWGGLAAPNERGVLYDYYTSPPIAALTWRLLNLIQPVLKNAAVLEPSCGTGVFFAAGPKDARYTGVELDKRTAAIASLLHPKTEIIPQSLRGFQHFRQPNQPF
jgi:hypothetical protein